jgi:hypothetical protein
VSKRATKGAASADGSKAAGSALDIVAAMDHRGFSTRIIPTIATPATGTGPMKPTMRIAFSMKITRPGRAFKPASASGLGHPSRPPYCRRCLA